MNTYIQRSSQRKLRVYAHKTLFQFEHNLPLKVVFLLGHLEVSWQLFFLAWFGSPSCANRRSKSGPEMEGSKNVFHQAACRDVQNSSELVPTSAGTPLGNRVDRKKQMWNVDFIDKLWEHKGHVTNVHSKQSVRDQCWQPWEKWWGNQDSKHGITAGIARAIGHGKKTIQNTGDKKKLQSILDIRSRHMAYISLQNSLYYIYGPYIIYYIYIWFLNIYICIYIEYDRIYKMNKILNIYSSYILVIYSIYSWSFIHHQLPHHYGATLWRPMAGALNFRCWPRYLWKRWKKQSQIYNTSRMLADVRYHIWVNDHISLIWIILRP